MGNEARLVNLIESSIFVIRALDTGNVFNLVESSSFHTRDSILNEISISGIQHTKANFITKNLLSIQFSPLTLDTSKVISLER